ncbi:DUF2971 domain-containing protein [Xenorhabdus siamensis]|uniref:DUF2971 domain-containing protein n=1 Tax=Xenorhabdus siamensis TaxID=3136254 RepID=UPI0030F4A8CC
MLRTVYHFTTLDSAKLIVRKQKLKVSRINKLNDPFELLSAKIGDKEYRLKIKKQKESANDLYGIISFSKSWKNPVQWAHYAERHNGVCLAFSIEKDLLTDIVYHSKRIHQNDILEPKTALKYKFKSWSYEQETRLIIELQDKLIIKCGDMHFIPFNDKIKLDEIIFGANTTKETEGELYREVNPNHSIKYNKARPAFKSFRMTYKKNWKNEMIKSL